MSQTRCPAIFRSPFQIRICLLVFILFLAGCASTYKPFNLNSYSYGGNHQIVSGIEISYVGDLQRLSKNGWYAKKENRYDLRAVAVRIHNATSNTIELNPEDIRVYAGDQISQIIRPEMYSAKIKQRVGIHMLHALYGPWGISWSEDPSGNRDVDFYYIPVGAIIGLGNAIRANKANKANAADIARLQVWNKPITPGETIYGVVLLSADPALALRFEAAE